MRIHLNGADVAPASDQVHKLFAELGIDGLQEQPIDAEAGRRADPFTVAVGISSILLALPGTIGAIVGLMDRSKRKTAQKEVEELKRVLIEIKVDCVLTTDTGRSLALPKAATDDVVDAIFEELAAPENE